ncbi:MAG TPA: hypothetical protein VM712_14830, partial [Gaiellales bacterium]|nr:hypothetical protein [Gaiellales bacterium]
ALGLLERVLKRTRRHDPGEVEEVRATDVTGIPHRWARSSGCHGAVQWTCNPWWLRSPERGTDTSIRVCAVARRSQSAAASR